MVNSSIFELRINIISDNTAARCRLHADQQHSSFFFSKLYVQWCGRQQKENIQMTGNVTQVLRHLIINLGANKISSNVLRVFLPTDECMFSVILPSLNFLSS